MRLEFITMFIGGLSISTNLSAVEGGNNPTTIVANKTVQNNLNNTHPRKLKDIHHYNNIFDDYSSGSMPYESYKK